MAQYILYRACKVCGGDGLIQDPSSEAPANVQCTECGGAGKVAQMELDSTELESKVQEIKTKLNQMQADINYIKVKVG